MKISKWILAGALLATGVPAAWAQTYVFKFGTKMPIDNTDDLYATLPKQLPFATLEYESDTKRFTLSGAGLKNFGPGNSRNLGPIYNFKVWKIAFDLKDDWMVYNRFFMKLSMNHSANIYVTPERGSAVDNVQWFSSTIPFDLSWGNMGWMFGGVTNDRNFVGEGESASWTIKDFDPRAIKGWPNPKAVAVRVINVAPGIARQGWYLADSVEILQPLCDGIPCPPSKSN